MTDGSADRPERWMHNAMTTDRPSADALPSRVARMQLRQSIDRQCDAEVVAAFEAVLAEAGDDYRMAVREDFNLTDESWS